MKIFLPVFLLSIFLFSSTSFTQIGVKINSLPPFEATEYLKPLSTWFGTYFNSGTYYDADVPDIFGFKFNIIGMWTLIPENQKTFQPNPKIEGVKNPDPTATVFGNKSSYYLSSHGYFAYPAGFALNSLPSGIYQFAGSLYNTELLFRFFPKVKFDKTKVGIFGVGLKHDFSGDFPIPVDISVQVLYNRFNFEYTEGDVEDFTIVKSNNFAFNVHGSKTFAGMFIAYAGMQVETSSMDLEYYFDDPNDLYTDISNKNHKVDIKGENVFRFTIGGAVKLGFFVVNADVNLTKLTTFTTGLSLDF